MSRQAHWFPVYVGIGSNLEMPARQVERAIARLAGIRASRLLARSSLYRSAAFGGIVQPDFINAAAGLLTQLEPVAFLEALLGIELRQGRDRDGRRWGPRVLDLDLLVYSGRKINAPGITVPHPGIGERNFVLLPLAEIAPELVIPDLGRVASVPVNMEEPRISRIE